MVFISEALSGHAAMEHYGDSDINSSFLSMSAVQAAMT